MKKITITITGNPLSDNTTYGHRAHGYRVIRYLTKRGKDYKLHVASVCKRLFKKYPIYPTGQVVMSIKIYFGDKRKRDVQGHLKILFDSFEGFIYSNDVQVISFFARKGYDKDNPRAEITFWEREVGKE